MKSAIYYRVSTDKQDVDSQKKAIGDYLRAKGIPESETKVYMDEGISGSSNNRPGYQQLIADCKAGKIKDIIVYKLDRFSRDANTAIMVLLDLDNHGVGFVAVSQPALCLGTENPFRRTMLSAFAEIAEIERQTLIERTNAGIRAAKARGVKFGPKVKVKEKVREKIFLLREEGLTIREIAKKIRFGRNTVHRVLKSKVES